MQKILKQFLEALFRALNIASWLNLSIFRLYTLLFTCTRDETAKKKGATGESNPGPFAPKAKIIPLDQQPQVSRQPESNQ